MVFAIMNNRLPASVDDLPKVQDDEDCIYDEWGNPIQMVISGDEVTLISPGHGWMAFRSDKNREIVGVFLAKHPDGKWVDKPGSWKKEPQYKRL